MHRKRVIESRGALQYIRAVLNLADKSQFNFDYNKGEVWEEILRRREHYREARRFLRSDSFRSLPCGQDDQALEQCEAIAWNFWTCLDSQQVNNGKMTSRMIAAWERAVADSWKNDL